MNANLCRVGVVLAAMIYAWAAPGQAGAADSGEACKVLTIEGKVEVGLKGSDEWRSAEPNQDLHAGDRLRTGLRSRATLRWSGLSVVRVDQLTSMEIAPPEKPDGKSQVNLRSGGAYLFSREKPGEIQFRTPVASGAIRGTEFNLAVASDGETVLSLLDGQVDMANAAGATSLKSGEQAKAAAGRAPEKTALINAANVIQWVLYYPMVIDPDEAGLSGAGAEGLKDSLEAYRAGDVLAALRLYPAERKAGSDGEAIYHAGLVLAAGRVDAAQAELGKVKADDPLAGAIRELIAAVKHEDFSRARRPSKASEWLAHSYYLQSRGRLGEAQVAAREAARLSERFGAAWVRVAELEFGFGETADALAHLDRGLRLAPKNAAGLALKGFLLAARNRTSEAADYFDQAIAADGALANGWLGRGLVRIRKGRCAEGLEDLQVAATLEPQRSVLRSYLGKGFANAHDPGRARKELDLAARLDPADPTARLYSALLAQEENRGNDAVSDLEKSKALNDNRSLFRSRLLLDQDQAVRGANLAAMYRDVGMFDQSVQEASRAVNYDYGNYSAHLFLANSYDTLRDPKLINLRYETPWFSELLVANLLQPVHANSLSQNISQQEYSKLFAKDGFSVFSQTEYSSHGDWIQRGSQSGVFGNTGYSLDAYYRTERGYRTNNDLEQLDLSARVKQELTEKDSVFLQVGYFDSESGDVAQYYNQSSASSTLRVKEKQEPNLLAGYHREWSPGNHTLFLFSRIDDKFKLTDPDAAILARTRYSYVDLSGNVVVNDFVWNPNRTSFTNDSRLDAYSVELQQILEVGSQTFVVGGRYQFGWADTESSVFRPADPNPFSVPIDVKQSIDSNLDRFALYAYDHWQIVDTVRLTAGISYDRLHYPRNLDTGPLSDQETSKDQVSPKVGLEWAPWADTHLRAAYSQSLGGAFFDQSVRLEPVQLAGFNQAFRSLVPESVAGLVPGTRFDTFGVGIDQRIAATRTYLFAQGEILKSDGTRTVGILTNNVLGPAPLTPDQAAGTPQRLDYEERSLILAINQLIGRDFAVGARYKLTDADLTSSFEAIPFYVRGAGTLRQDVGAVLNQVWLYGIFQHPCGFFAEAQAVWSEQTSKGYFTGLPGDDFWQYNLFAGYRFLQRRGELRIGVVNLSDRDYRLNPLTLYNELPRERTLLVSLKLNF